MFKSCGIHQDQIQRVAETFRDLYDKKNYHRESGRADGKVPSLPSGSSSGKLPESGAIRTASGRRMIVRRRLLSRSQKTVPLMITPAVECPCCGEKFPRFDLGYTENSGLCIPCWEAGVV